MNACACSLVFLYKLIYISNVQFLLYYFVFAMKKKLYFPPGLDVTRVFQLLCICDSQRRQHSDILVIPM